jgi:hypothetical protein
MVLLPTNNLSHWIPIQRMGALCTTDEAHSPPTPLCTHHHRPLAMLWQHTGSQAIMYEMWEVV